MRRWGTEDVGLEEAYGRRLIGQGVRRARLTLSWSQTQLGWRVGLHQSTISRLETGRLRTMRVVTLARIIGALRMTSHDLFPEALAGQDRAEVGGAAVDDPAPGARRNRAGDSGGVSLGPDAPPSSRRRLPGQRAA